MKLLETYELGTKYPIPCEGELKQHSERIKVLVTINNFQPGDIGTCLLYKNYNQKRNGNSYGNYTFLVKDVHIMSKSQRAIRVQDGENLRTSYITYEVLNWSDELKQHVAANTLLMVA